MSGSSLWTPLQGNTPDAFGELQKYNLALKTGAEATTEQERPAYTRAQTGLVGAQTRAADIKNQLDMLMLQGRIGVVNAFGQQQQQQQQDDSSYGGAGGTGGGAGGGGSGGAFTPAGHTGLDELTPKGGEGGTGGGKENPSVENQTATPQPSSEKQAAMSDADWLAQQAKTYPSLGGPNALARANGAAPGSPAATGTATAEAEPGAGQANPLQQYQLAGPASTPAPTQPPENQPTPSYGGTTQREDPNGTSRNGVNVPGLGPVSAVTAAQLRLTALSGGDLSKAMETAQSMRSMRLYQLAQGATDERSWGENVQTAWREGLLTNGARDQLMGHFQYQDNFVRSLASADKAVAYQQSLAERGLKGTGTGPQVDRGAASTMEPIKAKEPVLDANGKQIGERDVTIPRASYAEWSLKQQQGKTGDAGPMTTVRQVIHGSDGNDYTVERQVPTSIVQAGGAGAQGGSSFDKYKQMTREDEGSVGNDNVANKAGSGAVGRYQWMPDTWLSTVKQYAPDVARGKTDAQILALRGSDLEEPMMQKFTAANEARLRELGVPVNASTDRLAHWFGADGVKKMFSVDANTPIERVADAAVVRQNGLAGKTVGQVARQVAGRYGLGGIDVAGTGGAGAAPASGGAALPVATPVSAGGAPGPATPAPGATPAPAPAAAVPAPGSAGSTPANPPGTLGGNVELGPQQKADLEVQVARQKAEVEAAAKETAKGAEALGDLQGKITTAGADAATKLQRLDVLDNAAKDFRPGASAETRLAAMKQMVDKLQLAGVKPPDWMIRGATGGEVIGKEGGYLAAEMTRSLGSREAASVYQQIQNIQPNMNMSTGGFQAIVSSIKQGVLRDRDLATFQDQWLGDPAHHNSIRGMIDSFNQAHPVEAYASRVVPYPVPTSRDALVPNVIYRAKDGTLGLWDGQHMKLAPSGQ